MDGMMATDRGGKMRMGLVLGMAAALLASCAPHDPQTGLTKQDYRELMARRGPADAPPPAEPPIPELQPLLAAPTPPAEADARRVSIRVTEVTPLRDLLMELARRAEIDLEMDPRIQGGIIFSATDRPLTQVIERIADMTGLRYSFEDNLLRIELDDPYLRTYRLDTLALRRQSQSEISSSTDVFSAVAGGGTTAASNASTSRVTSMADIDPWGEVQSNIERILFQDNQPRHLVQMPVPPASPGEAAPGSAPAPAGGVAGALQAVQSLADTITAPPPAVSPAAASGDSSAAGATIQTVEREDTGPAATGPLGAEASNPNLSINRQAGIITVYTNQRRHREIADYLERVRRAISAQVLIEAKIVEVTLRDEFRAGIDWSAISPASDLSLVSPLGESISQAISPQSPTLLMGGRLARAGSVTIDGVLQLVDQFGSVRTLSSPRLTMTNNQASVLKVAENDVYFTLQIDRERDTQSGFETRTITSTVNTVPIGLIMTVQPSINLESRMISLNLRPTISRVARRVSDPAVALTMADINAQLPVSQRVSVDSQIPVVEVRELDSVVSMESGQVLVMGGLMQERSDNVEQGIPGLQDMPGVFGAAFKQQNKLSEVVELVIFLRATIVNDRESVAPADVDLYRRFAPDPRPIAF
ncbi:type II secretion system protein GspD [Telmatospirillum sp. J64-1]|uniref:type II secretion system protein GspD n=1 Tax=Telmatospirillum sp. J64-1 TaxID=2502183 RepID=UPI00115E3CE7|nr:type II and III secretion system protein [Telmatospirillum sp. J64-1]